MRAISKTEIDNILEISGMANECAAETEFPPALFRQMTELFGSKSCVYYSMSEDLDNHPIWNGVGHNLSGMRVASPSYAQPSADIPQYLPRRVASGQARDTAPGMRPGTAVVEPLDGPTVGRVAHDRPIDP